MTCYFVYLFRDFITKGISVCTGTHISHDCRRLFAYCLHRCVHNELLTEQFSLKQEYLCTLTSSYYWQETATCNTPTSNDLCIPYLSLIYTGRLCVFSFSAAAFGWRYKWTRDSILLAQKASNHQVKAKSKLWLRSNETHQPRHMERWAKWWHPRLATESPNLTRSVVMYP